MQKLRLRPQGQEGITGEVHLRVDPERLRDASPLLIADCEMHASGALVRASSGRTPGDIDRRPLAWHKGMQHTLDHATLAHLVYSKLIAPFSTVICLFAEDFGGLQSVAKLLALWVMSFSNRPSDLPPGTYPRVLVLTQWDDTASWDEQKATKNFMLDLGREAEKKNGILVGRSRGKLRKAELDRLLAAQFGGMRVVSLPPLHSSSRSWKSIKARILGDSYELQSRRKAAQVAFSALHFKAFFHLASDHFSLNLVSPFNFIRASRIKNLVL
jgi:hypothetical protein